MTDQPDEADAKASQMSNRVVMAGAGFVFLGRLGALIEPISLVLFVRLYSVPTIGLFLYLWSAVQLISAVTDLGMTSALQRFVPSQRNRRDECRVVRIALATAMASSMFFALVLAGLAGYIAPHIQTDNLPVDLVANVIRVYAIALPLWCFIDVTTATVRAQRVFGPEIRVRIFYEQGFRLISGVVFAFAGWANIFGLVVSHVLALIVAALFALRLLLKYYGVRDLLPRRDPLAADILGEMWRFSPLIVVNNFGKRLHSFMPQFFLNIMIPGAAGASAVAIFSIARKIVSSLQVIRQTFEYVLAPFASIGEDNDSRKSLREIYAFSTRFIVAVFIPIATGLIVLRNEVLLAFGPELVAGASALVILTIGRGVEAAAGPSGAIIEMIGRYRLPLYNAVAGNLIAAILCILTIPSLGVAGGAIAASVGLNITSVMAFVQVYRHHGLQPFDRSALRPLAVSILMSIGLAAVSITAARAGATVGIVSAIVGLIAVYYVVLNIGLSPEDRDAVDPKGRFRWSKAASKQASR